MKDILIKARQAFQRFKLLNHKNDYNSEITAIETAFNYAEENEQKLINLEEENKELKTKNLIGKSQFVKIKDVRIRVDSIYNYYYLKLNDYNRYIIINDVKYQCDSEKEAKDFIKMLDELLGVK